MPYEIVRNDITKMEVDAIVNPANPRPVIGSGTDHAIHKAAGPELLEARKEIGDIASGQSVATPAFKLHAQYVLHTVSPAWKDGNHHEEELLPKLLKNLYEDKVSGKMSEEDYAILSREYAEEREGLKKKVKAHRDRLRRIAESEGEREQFIRAIRKFMEMRTLTNQILRELIDHIDVYEVEGRGKNRTQRMVIYYKFVGYLEIPSHLSAPNYKAELRQGVAVESVSCEPTESARAVRRGVWGG